MSVDIEVLVIQDCPNGPETADLISAAVADTLVQATITRTIIENEDQARQRGFRGSPRSCSTAWTRSRVAKLR